MLVFGFLGGAAPVQGAALNVDPGYWYDWPLPPPMEIVREYPLMSGSLVLPAVPESGVVELDAMEMKPFWVKLEGKGHPYGGNRSWSWRTDHETVGFGYMEGGVYLRWFWNGKRCPAFSSWITDGNPGKGGTYRVELWQSQIYRDSGEVTLSENRERVSHDTYRYYKKLDSKTFELVIRGYTPLAEGEPPQFTEVPDLPPVPAVTMVPEVPEAGVNLKALATAGGPFTLRWFRAGHYWRSGSEVTVRPADLIQAGYDFYCEAEGPTGKAVTETFRLRRPVPVPVDFTASTGAVREGGTVRLVPGVALEPGVTFSWSGPALAAGYAGAQVLEDGTLEISPARLEDAGTYVYTVANEEMPASHSLQVDVVRLPEGVYPLRVGQEIPVAGHDPLSYYKLTVGWTPVDEAAGRAVAGADWVYEPGTMKILISRPEMAGTYRCRVTRPALLPRSQWERGNLVSPLQGGTVVLGESVIELRAPWEAPVMPAHALTVGRLGAEYVTAAPVTTAGVASAAVAYEVTGLPKGMTAAPDGTLTGSPLESGDFTVTFVAVNAQGSSAPLELRLSVRPLPAGAMGEWLGFSTPEESGQSLRIKMTATGAFTMRNGNGPAAGWGYEDEEGRVHLKYTRGHGLDIVLLPATGLLLATDSSGEVHYLHGWRKVWSRTNRPEVYAGRYNFYAEPLMSPRAEETSVNSGYRSGTALVGPTGVVKTVVRGDQGRTGTSSFFLGPQGQVVHEHKDRKINYGHYCIELAIDETGREIQGQLRMYREFFKTEGSDRHYTYGKYPSSWWPDLLAYDYRGRRYTPRKAGALPAGFTAPAAANATAANAVLTPGLPPALMRSDVPAEPQAWLLTKGGRMRPQGPVTRRTTCKVHLPTGMFSGKVQFGDPAWRLPLTKFQGFLIPQSEGEEVGYGSTGPASDWDSLPVTLEAAVEEE